MRSLLSVTTDPWSLDFLEPVGCAHPPQVVAVPAPPGDQTIVTLRDPADPGQRVLLQRSLADPTRGFLHLRAGLPAWARLTLQSAADAAVPAAAVRVRLDAGIIELDNGTVGLRLRDGQGRSRCDDGIHPGAVLGMRHGAGPWRGGTWFDVRHPESTWTAGLTEQGPLRCVWTCTTRFGNGQQHRLTITLDADSVFADVAEEFRCGPADQLVWAFSGDDLPDRFLLADSSAGHQQRWPNHDCDGLVTALAPWTQCSQQPDRSDGFALRFAGGDTLGVVAMQGGSWRGHRLNLLELWTRRWAPGEAVARRGLPAAAKADSTRQDGIPARGGSACRAHACLEGWIGQGSRRWALVMQPATAFEPPGGPLAHPPLGPFEQQVDLARCRAQQGLLRRIHTQHGILGLQEQLERVFTFPHPVQAATNPAVDGRLAEHHEMRSFLPPGGTPEKLDRYLEARVLGCWLGSGLAYVNVVVGRPIGACMRAYERFVADGSIDAATAATMRARIAWLAYLNADPGFYPGEATMRPLGDAEGSEPTMMGMANQNFFTDALIIPGQFAASFPAHPASAAWQAWSVRQWRLQLQHHVYPDSGVWEESHTYCQHVLVTVYPWMLRLRDSGGPDLFADAQLHLLLDGLVRQATPADAGRGGRRYLVPFGDHAADPEGYGWIYRRFADAIADADLAPRLRWLSAGMAGAPAASILASVHLRGLASMLRSTDAAGNETLMALRSGGAWGHHHEDDGSIWLFADGRGLIGDAAWGDPPWPNPSRKHSPDGHSRWVPRGLAVRNYLWRFSRGHPLAQDFTGPVRFSLAWCPVAITYAPGHVHLVARHPWHHQRLVAELAPGMWLVHDRCRPGLPGDVHFQVCGPPATAGAIATVPLPSGNRLVLQSLSGHAAAVGMRDRRGDGTRPASDHDGDTWDVIFPCGTTDSLVLITVGAVPDVVQVGDRWKISCAKTAVDLRCDGDAIAVRVGDSDHRLPVWLDPPIVGSA